MNPVEFLLEARGGGGGGGGVYFVGGATILWHIADPFGGASIR